MTVSASPLPFAARHFAVVGRELDVEEVRGVLGLEARLLLDDARRGRGREGDADEERRGGRAGDDVLEALGLGLVLEGRGLVVGDGVVGRHRGLCVCFCLRGPAVV